AGAWEAAQFLASASSEGVESASAVRGGAAVAACRKPGRWVPALHLLHHMAWRSLELETATRNAAVAVMGAGRRWRFALRLAEPSVADSESARAELPAALAPEWRRVLQRLGHTGLWLLFGWMVSLKMVAFLGFGDQEESSTPKRSLNCMAVPLFGGIVFLISFSWASLGLKVSSPQTMIKPKLELVGSAKVQPDSPQKGVSSVRAIVVIEKATAAERRRGRPKPREKLVQAAPERTRSTRSPLLASAEGCRRAVGAAGAHAPQGAAADELARRRRRCRPPAMWNQKSPRRHPSDSRPVTCGAR
ncbi:unnamed protein product, partial [Effrenium voratum]